MPLKQRIEEAGNLIKAITGLVALFPGLAVLLGIVPLPGTISTTVGFLSFFTSAVVLTAVFLLDDSIGRLPNKPIAVGSVATVVIGVAFVIAYVEFAEDHIVSIRAPADRESRFVVPSNPTEAITRYIDPAIAGHPTITEYQEALQGSIAPDELIDSLRQESRRERIVLIVLLLISHVLLITPIVTAAWKLTGAEPESAPPVRGRRGDGSSRAAQPDARIRSKPR